MQASEGRKDVTVLADHVTFDACSGRCIHDMFECDDKLPALYPSNVYGVLTCHKIANMCIDQCERMRPNE